MSLQPLHALSLSILLLGSAATAAPQLLLVNGDVFTADPARPRAQALAIEGGRIRAIGDSAQIRALAGPGTRVIDVGGRLVTPGLIEAHVHLGWNLPSPPLPLPGLPFPGPSAAQVLAAVEAAATSRTDWVCAWIGPMVARDRRNWREALDAVAPETPVLLRGFWGHTTIVNSAALKRLGIEEDVVDPVGGWWGRDANGRLDGRAYEAAETVEQQVRPPDPALLAPALAEAAGRYARWGITSIHLMNSGRSVDVALNALGLAKTPLKWTVYSWAGAVDRIADAWRPIDAALRRLPPRVRVAGPKWILDGTGVEGNAFERRADPDRPDWHGRSNYSDAQLNEILGTALQRPEHQLALHVVGDAETDRLLQAMERLAPAKIWRERRVRIEHGDGIRVDTLARVAQLGVVVTQNPTHFPPPPIPGATPPPYLAQSLLKSLADGGVPLALGSDAGPDEANPFLNIMLASTYAAAPAEALPREQALLAYTAGAAFAERAEHRKGRLRVGMAADLAVLSQNILQVPMQALPATRSMLTVIDGEIVFEDPVLSSDQRAQNGSHPNRGQPR